MTRGKEPDPQIAQYVRQILALPVDSSIFVPDATCAQLHFLRKPVKKAGAVIEIVKIEQDEIYGTAGVRVFRREGKADEL